MTNDDHPLDYIVARGVIRELRKERRWMLTRHCRERMLERNLSGDDIDNMFRGGTVTSAEWENGSWRYTVGTPRISVVVELDLDEREIVVLTAWRSQ